MEENLKTLKDFEHNIYDIKEACKKLSGACKDTGSKFKDLLGKDKKPETHPVSSFKGFLRLFSAQVSSSFLSMSASFLSQYSIMKDREVALYKERKQMTKNSKEKMNSLKIAKEQYTVALKEIQKQNKQDKDLASKILSEYDKLTYHKQKRIVDKNMKNIQGVEELLNIYNEEESENILNEIESSLQMLQLTSKQLYSQLVTETNGLAKKINSEIISSIKEITTAAFSEYQSSLQLEFRALKTNKGQRKRRHSYHQPTETEEDRQDILGLDRNDIIQEDLQRQGKRNRVKEKNNGNGFSVINGISNKERSKSSISLHSSQIPAKISRLDDYKIGRNIKDRGEQQQEEAIENLQRSATPRRNLNSRNGHQMKEKQYNDNEVSGDLQDSMSSLREQIIQNIGGNRQYGNDYGMELRSRSKSQLQEQKQQEKLRVSGTSNMNQNISNQMMVKQNYQSNSRIINEDNNINRSHRSKIQNRQPQDQQQMKLFHNDISNIERCYQDGIRKEDLSYQQQQQLIQAMNRSKLPPKSRQTTGNHQEDIVLQRNQQGSQMHSQMVKQQFVEDCSPNVKNNNFRSQDPSQMNHLFWDTTTNSNSNPSNNTNSRPTTPNKKNDFIKMTYSRFSSDSNDLQGQMNENEMSYKTLLKNYVTSPQQEGQIINHSRINNINNIGDYQYCDNNRTQQHSKQPTLEESYYS